MILVLRALGVGDLATGVPALRALRAAFPGDELVLAAPTWLTPLIDLIGGVDRVLPTDGLGGPAQDWLAGSPPKLAVNLHGSGPESHRLLLGTRPARLWAFRNAAAGHLDGPEWSDDEHEVRRWCRLLRHYRIDADESDLRLETRSGYARSGVTIVHPGAKSPSRRWPPERYAEVARRLEDTGHHVVITGSPAERDLTAKVAADAGLGPEALPGTDLAALAGLIAGARLLISGDTGVSHLATAFGTPSVTLFGPMSPARWGPPPDRPRHRVIWHGTRSERGDDPGPDVHPALLAVTVEETLAAAGQALASARC
ncbi:glycosyltransferase family 9 protein [Actinoplanes oblitus]|uniref:Glycosyltransferase family 9 protein n=1 Tax=Actinoplanes oblitus TaxID=3040509 RepID=A0ABY8WNQ6_9ACTN|nr:glycosyltransferase family 9 protein [Actinoplanes oblitus]WIM99475.1 glycosyltransferase family 9 protein [Actinoplanes oblitus]